VDFSYIWGVALQALKHPRVDLRLVNLETAVTRRGQPQPKGINYRMNPANLPLLETAGIDCCVLANNHVLDWGEQGLLDTLHSLDSLSLQHAGAGLSLTAAEAPAVLPLVNGRRLLLFAWATADCGVPPDWAAGACQPGVARLDDLSAHSLKRVASCIAAAKHPGDVAVVSLHWGGNWGFAVAPEQVRFAHGLIDQAGVDVLYGHSSHHIKALEVYRQRLILYGCGDLLDDYEGIDSHASYHADLGLLYFAELASDGRLLALQMLPTRQRRLSIQPAEGADRQWLHDSLLRQCAAFGCSVRAGSGQRFSLVWPSA
jgi:poly-gamma-glutamate synthesis protein (capsule biosynthesis protein)